MPKTVYLIHGWGNGPEDSIFPWLKKELTSRGYTVLVPQMPNTNFPVMEEWIDTLRALVTKPEDSILVGHSLGGLAVLIYLEQLAVGQKVPKVVCFAGVTNIITSITPENEAFIQPWLQKKLDAEKIKQSFGELVGFFSDNDPYIPLSGEEVLRKTYGARTVIEHGMGHYNKQGGVVSSESILREVVGEKEKGSLGN
jgi:predicted alpha/beta hydrolase family esterase